MTPPPVEMHAPQTAAWLFTLLQVAQFVPLTAYFVWRSLRTRDALPLLALAGGAVSGLFEPIVDHLTQLWWPTNMPLPLVTVFDIQIPLVTTIGYSFFLGLGAWFVFDLIRRGARARAIWAAAALFAVADLIYESPSCSRRYTSTTAINPSRWAASLSIGTR